MMFGASKELDDLRNRMAIVEREAQQLREIVAGLLQRVQELELKGQRPKSHFTKP
jgi:hypothetical protein